MFKQVNLIKIIKFGVYLALLSPLVYIPQTIYGAVFGKMIYFQIVVEAIFPFFLYLMIFHKGLRPKIDWLTKLILIFFISLIVASAFGADWHRSFWGYPSRMRGIFSLSHFLALYFYIIAVFRNEEQKSRLLFFVILVASLMSAYGIAERFYPHLCIDKTAYRPKVEAQHRILSATGNSIFFAGYLLFIVYLGVYCFFRYKKFWKWLALSAAILNFIALYFTGTRAALLGMAFGFGSVMFYFFLLADKRKKIIIAAAAAALIILSPLPFIFKGKGIFNNRYFNSMGLSIFSLAGSDGSISGRLLLYNLSLRAFKEHPFIGWGLENFNYAFNKYYDPRFLQNGVDETFADRAHNWFLDWLVMAGAAGLAAYLSIFIYLIYKLLKKEFLTKENAWLFGIIPSFFIFSFFSVDGPEMNLALFYFFAFLYFVFNKERNQAITNGAAGRRPAWLLIFILPVAASVYLFNIKPLFAGADFIRFLHSGAEDLTAKKTLAEGALDGRSPYLNEMRLSFGNRIFLDGGTSQDADYMSWGLKEAIEEIGLGYASEQENFAYPFLLGNLYLRQGSYFGAKDDYSKAMEYYDNALKISSKRQSLMFQMATAYLLGREGDDAIQILEKAIALDTRLGQPYWRLAMAYLAEKDNKTAYDNIKISMKLGHNGMILEEIEKAIALCNKFNDEKGAIKLAIRYYTLVSESDPDNPENVDSYLILADLYVQDKDYFKAMRTAVKAREVDPTQGPRIDLFIKQLGY